MQIVMIRNSSRRIGPTLITLFLLCVALIGGSAWAGPTEGREALKKGKDELSKGRNEEAIADLSAAERDFPLLGDYALYYLSEAYHSLGSHRRSIESVRALRERYPGSPLIKNARLSEIREAGELDEDPAPLYEKFLRDYPSDEDAAMRYGRLLKKKGGEAKAEAIFREVYLKAGSLSSAAFMELNKKDFSPQEVAERAANLMKRYEFRTAEQELRSALSSETGKNRQELLKSLGYALFKQKEYREASVVFERAHDVYYTARSLYRAGKTEAFERALQDLLKENDGRAGDLLIAEAADKRRDRDFEGALRIYREVLGRFPADSEEALWGIGWTLYVSGEYGKAEAAFGQMKERYADPKYLYWQARSIESLGGDPKPLYLSLLKSDRGYYGALAYVRGKVAGGGPVDFKANTRSGTASGGRVGERVEALLSIGWEQEAVAELACYSKKAETLSDVLYAISKFQEMGEFKRSISLATKLPYTDELHDYCFPLAFWADVERISKKYGIDPIVVLSVMREESRFDVNAKSVAGARGLMQMMPQTALRLEKELGLGIKREAQMHDATISIHLGAYYLKSLFAEFKSLPHVLAAYNAGEIAARKWDRQMGPAKAVDEYVEDIPFAETRNYVKKVVTSYYQYKRFFPAEKMRDDLALILGPL